MGVKTRREGRHDPLPSLRARPQSTLTPASPGATPPNKDLTTRSLRQLTHDLANALGGARLRLALIRADAIDTPLDLHNVDALERLLNQACRIEAALQTSINRLTPSDTPAAVPTREPKPRRTRSLHAR